jgi:hypothetical protein
MFRVCRSVHLHTFKLINQPDAAITRNYRFIVGRLIPLNMFRASLCPSSGAYELQQQQPLVYRRNVVVAVLLVVVGSAGRPAGPTTTNSTAITTLRR